MQVWRKKLDMPRRWDAADMATAVQRHLFHRLLMYDIWQQCLQQQRCRHHAYTEPCSLKWTYCISAVPQVKALVHSSQNVCAWGWRENAEMKGRAGHLLGNRAWAWDVRTNLWDKRLGWMAWLGAKPGLGICVIPAWLMEVTEPTTVPAKVWPKAKGVAPKTCCP